MIEAPSGGTPNKTPNGKTISWHATITPSGWNRRLIVEKRAFIFSGAPKASRFIA